MSSYQMPCGCDALDLLCPHTASMRATGREGATVGAVIAAENAHNAHPAFWPGSKEWQRRAMQILCGVEVAERLLSMSEADLAAE